MAFQISKEILPKEVMELLEKGESLVMLDVREMDEWEDAHVEGAKHIPLGQLMQRKHELDPKQEMIVMCRSGNRSGLACELLSESGFNVVNMTGGLSAWNGKLVRG